MAQDVRTQDTRTSSQQNQRSQQTAQQGSQLAQRESQQQQGGLSRRGSYDPFPLMMRELFNMSPFTAMNPFSLMRRIMQLEPESGAGPENAWLPAIEVSATDNKYVVRAELAGLKPDDVRIEITDDVLVIEGERRYEHEEEQGGTYRTERRYGRFYRAIPLPDGADTDNVEARFNDGVLEIAIPMTNQQNRRQIPIQGSEGSSQTSGASQTSQQAGSRSGSSGSGTSGSGTSGAGASGAGTSSSGTSGSSSGTSERKS